jgi:hypothetical protein
MFCGFYVKRHRSFHIFVNQLTKTYQYMRLFVQAKLFAFALSFLAFHTLVLATDDGCPGGRTQTPGGWGAPANGNNPGAYRDAHFNEAFPSGLTIGCGSNTITFTTAAAIEAYLPCGGKAKLINGTYTNPACQKNVFSNHLIAAMLSVGFDIDNPDFGSSQFALGELIIGYGTFSGMTVSELIAIANEVIGGCSTAYTPQQLTGVLTSINENYVDGAMNGGFLLCPSICEDTIAPSVTGESELTMECGGNVPLVMPVFTDNVDTDLTVDFAQSTDATECTQVITRVWRAEDDCGNFTLFVQTITAVDTQDPVLSSQPANMNYPCGSEIPAPPVVTATDICDNDVQVVYSEEIGEEGEEGCTIVTPDGFTNPDWSMVLFNFLGASAYFTTQEATYSENGNAIAITATLVRTNNPGAGFFLTLNLENGMNWEEWSNQPFLTDYKDDFNVAGNNYLDWMYYIVGAGSTLTGWGDYEGSSIVLTHAPSNFYYGFQKGIAANNVSANDGIGGWMYYEGTFVNNGVATPVDAAGDLAWDFNCCSQPSVTRTWTATDCSENSVTHTQVITFTGN